MTKRISNTFSPLNILVILFAFYISIQVLSAFFYISTEEDVSFIVVDKERVTEKETSKYLIFTENETFENVDSLFYLKYNSSDLYGKIIIGNKYCAKVVGYRYPLLSLYRNIVKINDCI
jgi:hypothetical protein